MKLGVIIVVAGVTGTLLLAATIIYLLLKVSKIRGDLRILATVSQHQNNMLQRLQSAQTQQPHYVATSFEGYTKVTWSDGTENWVWTGYQDY